MNVNIRAKMDKIIREWIERADNSKNRLRLWMN